MRQIDLFAVCSLSVTLVELVQVMHFLRILFALSSHSLRTLFIDLSIDRFISIDLWPPKFGDVYAFRAVSTGFNLINLK